MILILLLLSALALPAAERPNIVIIMADDMGYSDIGCYGGEIRTPNLDSLAANGLRFRQFYNAARCCPTRASLLTGLYAHQTGIGHMTNEDVRMRFDMGYDSYRGQLNRQCVTIGEALNPAGYKTLMAGKWHVGTFEGMWPVDRGFEEYFGIVRGASNFFRPLPEKLLVHNRDARIVPGEDFYTTDAFTDHAIRFVEQAKQERDERPFFLYLAYTSPHWPMHAWPEDAAKYRGRYRAGWEALRLERYQRMLRMGVLDRRLEADAVGRLALGFPAGRHPRRDGSAHGELRGDGRPHGSKHRSLRGDSRAVGRAGEYAAVLPLRQWRLRRRRDARRWAGLAVDLQAGLLPDLRPRLGERVKHAVQALQALGARRWCGDAFDRSLAGRDRG